MRAISMDMTDVFFLRDKSCKSKIYDVINRGKKHTTNTHFILITKKKQDRYLLKMDGCIRFTGSLKATHCNYKLWMIIAATLDKRFFSLDQIKDAYITYNELMILNSFKSPIIHHR